MVTMHTGDVFRTPYVWHPRDGTQAIKLKQAFGPDAVLVSGATLLRTHWENGSAVMPGHLIDLSEVQGMLGITVAAADTTIGAMTALSAVRRNGAIANLYPLVTEAVRQIAAPSIRNLATIGGNVASGVGDVIPSLLALDALTVWQDGSGHGIRTEQLALGEWLDAIEHYRNRPARLLLQVKLPADGGSSSSTMKRISAYHKVGRREAFTPSVATTAFLTDMDSAGRLVSVRIAAAGGQAMAHRLPEVEKLLEGTVPDTDLLPALHEAVMSGYRPVGDLFAGESYRRQTAANLIASDVWTIINKREGKG
jgi:carbon-monoxide dehydrogenase medium subunit